MSKTSIPKFLKWQVFERDRFTCRYCGVTGVPLEVDHVYPESKGGPTILENLAAACEKCNRNKGGRLGIYPMPVDYVARLAYANQVIEWYEELREQVLLSKADRLFQEKMNRLNKWSVRRKRQHRLVKLIPNASLLMLVIACILSVAGLFLPSPSLLVTGYILILCSIVLVWSYKPIVKWHTAAGNRLPDLERLT